MARYPQTYSGERRTAALCVQLTPGERAELEVAAADAGLPLSHFVRALCFRRVPEAGARAGVRRNPDAQALAHELAAIGNNLNQLARVANTTRMVPAGAELRDMLGLLKAAFARVVEL